MFQQSTLFRNYLAIKWLPINKPAIILPKFYLLSHLRILEILFKFAKYETTNAIKIGKEI